MRDGSDPCLQLEALAEAGLEVLRAAEALQAAANHDADTLAEGFAFLHAEGMCVKGGRNDTTPQIRTGQDRT